MNRDTLKQIIIDQKDMYLNNPIIARNYVLEENADYCFVGIRRTKKYYLCTNKSNNVKRTKVIKAICLKHCLLLKLSKK